MSHRKRPERATVEKVCPECGTTFRVCPSAYIAKAASCCSAECRQARKLRIKGKACLRCGSLHLGACDYCSVKCRRPPKVKKVPISRTKPRPECPCCGKSLRNRRYTFCTRQCAGRYERWERDRLYRCPCGKATGKHKVMCFACMNPGKQMCRDEWYKALLRMVSAIERIGRQVDDWEARLANMAQSLRTRSPPGKQEIKSLKVTTWRQQLQQLQSMWRGSKKEIDPWRQVLENQQGNMRKRRRRQSSNCENSWSDNNTDVPCQGFR
jgi:hypothetical protein